MKSVLALTLIFIIVGQSAYSLDLQNKGGIGIYFGKSITLEPNDFKSVELLLYYSYPWKSKVIPGFILSTRTVGSIGVLNQEGDSELLTTFSQLIVLTNSSENIAFDIGGGFALLGNDQIGDHFFGTLFQFNYNVGVTLVRLYKDFSLGYRLFHISDGGLEGGHGLNRHVLELRYEF